MSLPAPRRLTTMSIPTVTEIVRRPEPVAHDTFIDDLRRQLGPGTAASPLRT
jgi:hypothetical protein